MSYHFFSDPEYAGPQPFDIFKFWDKGGHTLRKNPRKTLPTMQFSDYKESVIAELATSENSKEIAQFWKLYYKGEDWGFSCSWADVERWLKSGFILIIKRDGAIVGTFVCHYLKGVFCGTFNSQAALLDGLVIAPWLRGQGLASYLLAAMDHFVYLKPELSQSILIWFREHSNRISAVTQNPISILEYSYAKISSFVNHDLPVEKANRELVDGIVKTISNKSNRDFTLLSSDTSDPDVYWYLVEKTLIGIAFTHRIATGDYTIWELVFAANITEPFFDNLQRPIEKAAQQLPCSRGLLFGSNGKSRGNLQNPTTPWIKGTAGLLTTHVYNWMPPTFLSGDIFFPHSCI